MTFLNRSIGRKKKISKRGYGHPLTELIDDYHAHRVEFKSSKARDKFFREAKTPNKEMSIPFTSSRQCFKYYELNNHIIFVARQTLDMLVSKFVSENEGETSTFKEKCLNMTPYCCLLLI